MREKYVELLIRHPALYTKVDELIAELGELNYEGFWEKDDVLLCYIPLNNFSPEALEKIRYFATDKDFEWQWTVMQDRNWNKLWEEDFEPVLISNSCLVRAPFHEKRADLEYDIIIEPQMSFGTGHHETTALMIRLMLEMDLSDKKVLDMGTGTGVLAILASMMNAAEILAVDNNDWAFENAMHNTGLNNASNINVQLGDIGSIKNKVFDIIIANINRNTLLDHIIFYSRCLDKDGILLLSGFFVADLNVIDSEAKKYRLKLEKYVTKNDWIAVKYSI